MQAMNIKKAVMALAIVLGLPTLAGPVQAGGVDDDALYAAFDQANAIDISIARLGWKKAQSKEVRDLASMVVNDHIAVQIMGRQLAHDLGYMGVPADSVQAAQDHARTLRALDQFDGARFDEAYIRHEIAFHTRVIGEVKTILLPNIENPQFKNLVENVLPGFEHHLVMTKVVADKLGVTY